MSFGGRGENGRFATINRLYHFRARQWQSMGMAFLGPAQTRRHYPKYPRYFCTILDERKKALEQGAANYLIKPVYADVLRKHIQALLEKNGGVHR